MAFWKKNKGVTIGEGDDNPAEQEIEEVTKKTDSLQFGDKIDFELAKIHGRMDSFKDMSKASNERFSVINEQIGEIRGMMTDITQQFSKIEVESTKAIDRVDSVQPEIFMTELRKNEGKIDALKANIESNESLMKDIMNEVKAMRHKMDVYKGTEQILSMHEEVKGELADIKKVEAMVDKHASRVDSIFLDVSKKFAEFEQFDSSVKDLSRQFQKIQNDFEKIRVQVETKGDKKEFIAIVNKFNDFEKHTGNIIKLLDERSKHIKRDTTLAFEQIKEQLEEKFDVDLKIKAPSKTVESKEKQKKKGFGFFGKKKDKKEGEESEEESDDIEEDTETNQDKEDTTEETETEVTESNDSELQSEVEVSESQSEETEKNKQEQ